MKRSVGELDVEIDGRSGQCRPAAVDAVIREQECWCNAPLANELGKAEVGNGPAVRRIDAHSSYIAQALDQPVAIGGRRSFLKIAQPGQWCHAEIDIVDDQLIYARKLGPSEHTDDRGGGGNPPTGTARAAG